MPKPLIKISGKALDIAGYFHIPRAFFISEEPDFLTVVNKDLERTKFFDKKRSFHDCERMVVNNAGMDYAQGKLTGGSVAGIPNSMWVSKTGTNAGLMFEPLKPNQKEFEPQKIYIAIDAKGHVTYKLLGKNNKLHEGTITLTHPVQSLKELNLSQIAHHIRQLLVEKKHLDEYEPKLSNSISFDLLFFNNNGTLSGLSLNYYPDYPDYWYISLAKEANAPFSEQNLVCFGHPEILAPMEYDDESAYSDDFEVKVENITGDNLFATLSKELNATDLTALLKPIFTDTGNIHAENLKKLFSQLSSRQNICCDKPNKEILIKKLQEEVQALYELPPIPLRDQLIIDINNYLNAYQVDEEWEFCQQQEVQQELSEENRGKYTYYTGYCTLSQLEDDYNLFQERKNRLIEIARDFERLNNSQLLEKFAKAQTAMKEYYLKKIAERWENKTLSLDPRYPYYYDILQWMYQQKAYRDLACAQYSDQQVRTLEFLEFLDIKNPITKLIYNLCLEGKVEKACELVSSAPAQHGFTKEQAHEFCIRGLNTPQLLRHTHQATEASHRQQFIREIAGRLIRQAKTQTDIECYLYNSDPRKQKIISQTLFGTRHRIADLDPIQAEVQNFLKKQCIKLEQTAKGILKLPEGFCQNRKSWQDNEIAMSPLIEDPYEKMETYRNALRAVLSDPHLTNMEPEALGASAIFCSAVVTLLCLVCPLVLVGSIIAAAVCYYKTGSIDFLNTPDSQEVSYKLHKVGHKLGLFLPVPEKTKIDGSGDNGIDYEEETGSTVEHAIRI